jgi:glycerol-3-phosphate dehydrogenase subunit C
MCVTYCGAFPLLFAAIDRDVDAERAEGAEALDHRTFQAVSDHCWQCKLCFIKCPYTVDEGAPELIDFPRLMAREKAQRARRDGVAVVDRVLGEPELIGKLGGGLNAPITNLVNKNRLVRRVAEKVTGISREFPLPPLAREPFSNWFSQHRPREGAGSAGAVVLFPTCYGEYNFPGVPQAAVGCLEQNGYSVTLPDDLACCGMPNLDGGDVERAKHKMEHNVVRLLPHVRAGTKIVVGGPTCGYTMKKEWPLYLGTSAAADVAAATVDLMEFFDQLRRSKKLVEDFATGLGKVAYHASCHLRAQKIAIPGARVLARTPNTDVRIVERCSAVDGTWGMKAAYYEEGARYAARLDSAIRDVGDDVTVVTDCSLAGLRVLSQRGTTPLHPIEALAKAYGIVPSEK